MSNGVQKVIAVSLIVCGGISIGWVLWVRHMFAFESGTLFAKGKATRSDVQKASVLVPGISITVWDGKDYGLPADRIPRGSFKSLWQLLGITLADWKKRDLKQMAGKWCPIAPNLPLLSKLSDIEVDNIEFSNQEVGQLQKEIRYVQNMYKGGRDDRVLKALSVAADMASAQGHGLILSPFG